MATRIGQLIGSMAKVDKLLDELKRSTLQRVVDAATILGNELDRVVPDGREDELGRPRRFMKLRDTQVIREPVFNGVSYTVKIGYSAPQAKWSDEGTDGFYPIRAASSIAAPEGRGSRRRDPKTGRFIKESEAEPGEEYLLFYDEAKRKVRREFMVMHPGNSGRTKKLGWFSNTVNDAGWEEALERAYRG